VFCLINHGVLFVIHSVLFVLRIVLFDLSRVFLLIFAGLGLFYAVFCSIIRSVLFD